jgi:hypothetical protein
VSRKPAPRQPSVSLASTQAALEPPADVADPDQDQDREKAGEKRMPVVWRVFGSAVLSIVALVCLAAYQQLTGQVACLRHELSHLNKDLRKDLGRISESYGELVKKEECNTKVRGVWDAIKELRTDRSDLTTLKERCAVLLEVFKAGEAERQQLVKEIQALRESSASAQERRELVKEIHAIRERIAALEGGPARPATTPAGDAEEQESGSRGQESGKKRN